MISVQGNQTDEPVQQKKANPARRTILIILFMLSVMLVLVLGAHASGFFDEPKDEDSNAAATDNQNQPGERTDETNTGATVQEEHRNVATIEAETTTGDDVQKPIETDMKSRVFNFIQNPKVKMASAVAGVMMVVIIAVVVWQLSGLQSLDEIINPNSDSAVDPDVERAHSLARQKEACKEELFWKTLANGLMPLCGLIIVGLAGIIMLVWSYKYLYKHGELEFGWPDWGAWNTGNSYVPAFLAIFSALSIVIGIAAAIMVPFFLGNYINLFSLCSGAGLALICVAITMIVTFSRDELGMKNKILIGSTILGVLGAVGMGAGLFISVFTPLLF